MPKSKKREILIGYWMDVGENIVHPWICEEWVDEGKFPLRGKRHPTQSDRHAQASLPTSQEREK